MTTAGTVKFPPLPSLVPGPDGYRVPPVGRWTCSRAQFERKFVVGKKRKRQRFVDDLDTLHGQQTRHGLVVLAYWIGGSFVSDKDQPDDIDVTAIIDGATSRPDAAAPDWINSRTQWRHHVHPDVGRSLHVDAFTLVKLPDRHPDLAQYRELRGYWDDWWQRSRATGEALSRGYLEVVWT